MTRRTNARLAGFAFLFYIATGITSMVLSSRATSAEGVASHGTGQGVTVLLTLCMCFSALLLGVTLWALTRDEDPDLAMVGLVCRVAEGVIGGVGAAYLLRGEVAVTATFFAVGSTAFCWLLLRGRMIPTPLAWLGVIASVLLVVTLPLQAAGFLSGVLVQLIWLPMAAFEIPLGFWLIIKGARTFPK